MTSRWRFCNTIHCDVEERRWGTESSPSFTCPLVLVLSASEPPELSSRTETVVFCRTPQDRSASGHSPRVITAAHKESSWVCVFTAHLYKQVYYSRTPLSSFEDKTLTHNVNSFFVLVSGLDLRVCRSPCRVRATVVKELMGFHPVIHTRTHTHTHTPSSLWKSVYVLKSISSWRRGCTLCIWTLTHRKYVKPFNQTSSVGLDPSDDVKNLPLHLYSRTLPVMPSEDQFLYFYHVCLVYFFLLCSLFLSLKPLYYGNSSFMMSAIFIKKQ